MIPRIPTWLRSRNLLIFTVFCLASVSLSDPPAVQEAYKRNREKADRQLEEEYERRVEEYQRTLEQRVEKIRREESLDAGYTGHLGLEEMIDVNVVAAASAMIEKAESLLPEARAEDALPIAIKALSTLRGGAPDGEESASTTTAVLSALNLVAEIHLELGDASTARSYFLNAVSLDPDGRNAITASSSGGSSSSSGADPFLQLAQLSDIGGHDSVSWFSRGAAILRREINALESSISSSPLPSRGGGESAEQDEVQEEAAATLFSKRTQLAGALCGTIEVYMTDLSLDPNAESQCEALISEALLAAPWSAEVMQTLASIRISQERIPEAQEALRASMAVWRDSSSSEREEQENEEMSEEKGEREGAVPDFPTRISLARLLMEVEMEEEAMAVVERLVQEDDGSVEAWYLGGWCFYLLGMKRQQTQQQQQVNGNGGDDHKMQIQDVNGHYDQQLVPPTKNEKKEGEGEAENLLGNSRDWLRQSLTLYQRLEYEDERLRDHALELVGEIESLVGGMEEEGEGEWNGFEDDDIEEDEEEEDEEEEEEDGVEEMDEG